MALRLNLGDMVALHDDTEEDLVGSDLHQDAITEAHAGIQTYAEEQSLPWYVTKQVMLIATLSTGDEWRPSPDVYVVPGVPAHPRASYDTRVEPFPPFIIEVASKRTARYDSTEKDNAFRSLGTVEYLQFDPTGEELGTQVQARRRASAASTPGQWTWQTWTPDQNGLWHSEVLGLGFRPEGVLLRVIRPDGSVVATRRELNRRVAELEQDLRRLRGQ